MPGRLTDHISELIGADQLERLSSILQTTPASAATALRTALDGTVKGLAEVATPAGGTTRLGAMLEQEGITALDRLDEMLGRGEDVDGTRLASDILGPRVDAVADSVSSAASLNSRDAGLLTLGFAAPLAVSSLARRQRDETLTAAAIGALLIAERDETAAALVGGGEAAPPPTAEAQLAAKALDATREETARHEVEGARRRKYAWPFIVLFAIIGVILAIVLTTTLGGSDDEPAAPAAESAEAEAPAPEPSTPPPPAEPEPPADVLAIATADGGFSILLGALDATGLDAELSSAEPLTLLAPTDEAFESLPDGVVESLLADPVRLQELLSAHVLDGVHTKDALGERSDVPTQDGRPLTIELDGTTLVIGGATVIKADQRSKNGMLHSIDAVIEPEGFELIVSDATTVLDATSDAGSFSTLLLALDTANLSETLAGEGPFTLLAPTDEAFAKLPDGALEAVLADPAALEQLLTAHVTGGVQLSSALAERSEIATITGQILPIVSDGTSVTIGGSLITTADIEADNGIVHVVDSVIFPEGLALGSDETAIDVLETTDEFTSFLDALAATGQADTLRGPGPYTVFAPTNAAFAALPESVQAQLANDRELLEAVLGAHFANGALDTTTIAAGDSFQVSSGDSVAVISDGDLIWIGGTRIVESLDSGNAVVHVVDRVIIPPSFEAEGTVNELLALSPVRFQVASSELAPAGQRVLNRTAAYLRTNPVATEIGGHTDSDGDEEPNLELSVERAETVADFLAASGVDPNLLTAVGYGEAQPVASNSTNAGKTLNRRIEFTILN